MKEDLYDKIKHIAVMHHSDYSDIIMERITLIFLFL
jgi:hypothetical protein